ncbi:MAG: ribonuclease Z [Candidatus Woesearchaeota archaeon]
MEIVFLGTSCMSPTKDRNPFSVFIRYKNEGILVDCGEGTQRQFKISDISLTKITKILITHWHGDHILGLPGLMQTLGASQYNGKLSVYGPKGTKKFFENLKKSFYFDLRIEYEIIETNKDMTIFENKDFQIEARYLEHGVPCLGYRISEKAKRRIDMNKIRKIGIPFGPLIGKLQDDKSIKYKGKKIKPDDVSIIENGKSIAIVVDTVMCKNALKLANNADLLIAESTFTSDLEEKGEEYGHLTAGQAASLANLANVKSLILTHFSQRYKTMDDILEDAKKTFKNVKCAFDLMKIKV